MDSYITKFNNFLTSIRNHKDFERDGIDYTDTCQRIVEWLRNNPDPVILTKAFDIESKHLRGLLDYIDAGKTMTTEEYTQFIINRWN